MLYILFGLPGAGKTFTGKIFQETFGFYFLDGDELLPENMKHEIEIQHPVTDKMRDEFFQTILEKITKLMPNYKNIVLTQTYIKEKYRKEVLSFFPSVEFIFIDADVQIRESRLLTQNTYPLTLSYVQKMVEIFETPQIPYRILDNNKEGKENLISQIQLLLHKN